MQVHRLQQGHNLVRIDFGLNRRKTAVRLAGKLVSYLEGRIEELPYHHSWRTKSLQVLPGSLIRALIFQIVS